MTEYDDQSEIQEMLEEAAEEGYITLEDGRTVEPDSEESPLVKLGLI